MVRTVRQTAAVFLLAIFFAAPMAPNASASDLEALQEATVSDDTKKIREVITASTKDALKDPEVSWRLLKAYFRYFDELAERDREKDREWAADAMQTLAEKTRDAYPKHPKVRYWSAMANLAYLQTYKMKALFIAGDVMDEMEIVRKMDPTIDDWGPDRVLGILSYSLPGWPLSRGDNDKALEHLTKASDKAPHRAVNRIYHARALLKDGQAEKAKAEIAFLEKGEWEVSSPHWREISKKQILELVEEAK